MKPKPTPEDKVNALLDFLDEDDDAAAPHPEIQVPETEEEVDAFLRKAGFDVEAENAKGQAEHEAAVRLLEEHEEREQAQRKVALPERKPAPSPEPWYRRYGGAFLVAAAVEFAGLVYASGILGPGVVLTRSPVDDARIIHTTTEEAAGACASHDFGRCLRVLDELQARYPKTSEDPVVKGLREGARAGLAGSAEPH